MHDGTWPFGDGEMAKRIHTHDWAATALGPVRDWSPRLTLMVEQVLASPAVSSLVCGPERLLIYNDAAARLYGDRHPAALGRPLPDSFPEGWRTVAPLYERVFAGENVHVAAQALDTRGDGRPVDVFDAILVPVREADGRIAFAHMTGMEIGEHLRTEAALRASEAQYRHLFDVMDEGFCVIEVLFDDARRPFDYRFLSVNTAFEHQTGLRDAVGRTIKEMVPGHEAHWFENYGRIAVTGASERFEDRADALGRWYDVFAFRVGAPERRQVGILFKDVLVRKRTEAALHESEARFRAFVTASSDVVYRMSPDWSQMHQLEGRAFLRDTDEPSRGWLDRYIHPENQAVVRAAIELAIRTKSMFELEHRVIRADGSLGWTKSRAAPVLTGEGEIKEWLGTASDVTASKTAALAQEAAEAALRDSEARLRAILDQAPLAIAFTGRSGEIQFHNAMFDKLWGRPAHATTARTYSEVYEGYHLDGRSLASEEWPGARAVLEGEVIEDEVYEIAQAGGRRIACWFAAGPIRDEAGGITGGVVLVRDVTEERRTQDALRESEERFAQFAASSSDALWIRDAAMLEMEYASSAIGTIYGVPPEAILDGTENWTALIVPEDRDTALAHLEQARAGGAVVHEFRISRPSDGATRWVRNTDFPLRDAHGRVQRIGGIAKDVTELKAAEAALTHSEQRLRSLVEGVPQLVWRAVEGGHWTWASPQWTAYTGQAEPDSHGLGWLDPVHPDDRASVMATWAGAVDRGEFHADYRVRNVAEGRYRWFQTRATLVRGEHGEALEWLGTSTDVDDLRRLQESQSVMVAELQHRTRNLIAVVRGIADDTMDHTGPTETFRDAFADRLSALSRVQGLLSRSEAEPITIGTLMRLELDALGAGILGERVVVDGPDVFLRPSTVQTLALALHELATNARKYGALSHDQGRLAVTWRERIEGAKARLAIEWLETGLDLAPERLAEARQGGYGRELIEHALPHAMGARTSYALTMSGVRCTLDIPVRPGPWRGEP